MQAAPLSAEHREAAAEVASRLGAILLGLAALVARAFLRDPLRVGLIVPLWTRLTRAAHRFQRLMARAAEGREQPRPARAAARSGPRPPRLPSGEAWLVVALRHDGAAYACRLQHLLSDPGAAALIAAIPQAASLLRPLCHMLGVTHPAIPRLPRRTPRRAPATPAPSAPHPAADQRSGPARGDRTGEGHAAPRTRPIQEQPPPRPLAETAPCPHVFWPWFPDRLRGG